MSKAANLEGHDSIAFDTDITQLAGFLARQVQTQSAVLQEHDTKKTSLDYYRQVGAGMFRPLLTKQDEQESEDEGDEEGDNDPLLVIFLISYD
jgi:hypothetical protein